ncbi:MAG: single-stranded DNA-binding protein [Bacteroidetes bacterium]|nr:single-stranded DNA-binding protein [Bacteroidota bacterium]
MSNNAGVNRVFLLGRVEKEPAREFVNGEHVLYFPLKTTEEIKKGDGLQEHFEFHNMMAPLEIVKNGADIKEGDILYVQGKIQTRIIYENGVKLYRCEILATSIEHVKISTGYLDVV